MICETCEVPLVWYQTSYDSGWTHDLARGEAMGKRCCGWMPIPILKEIPVTVSISEEGLTIAQLAKMQDVVHRRIATEEARQHLKECEDKLRTLTDDFKTKSLSLNAQIETAKSRLSHCEQFSKQAEVELKESIRSEVVTQIEQETSAPESEALDTDLGREE